jgi:hypothetical protein
MDKRAMVSIENLKASQPTRPRHWIPVYCAIILLLCLLVDGLYTVCSLTLGEFSATVYSWLPDLRLTIGDAVFGKDQIWLILILPASMVLVNLFAIIGACRMASFRKVYWWYAIWALLAYIAMFLYVTFWNLFTFVPGIHDALSRFINQQAQDVMWTIFVYGNIGYSALLVISMVFGLFYCVNYPAKYERIYSLRKRHLKALPTADERIAYRKRFYRDYKKGKWISMMLDLHAESLKAGQATKMDQDAYDFLVYHACLCDSEVKKAIFDEYARNGRYFECRALYNEVKAKSQAVEDGAKVRIPTYVPTVEPRVERRPKPKPKPAPAPKRRHYRPDEI